MTVYGTRVRGARTGHYCPRCGRQIDGTTARRNHGYCTDCNHYLQTEEAA